MRKLALVALVACTNGKEPVCGDVADCDDPACASAAVCTEDTDVDTPEPTPEDTDDTDVVVESDPLDFGWDGSGTRPPGPHPTERDRATAWQVDEESIQTSYNGECGSRNDVLDSITQPPTRPISRVPQDTFYHVFFRVSTEGLTAESLDCPEGEYPDCDVGSLEYVIDPETHVLLSTVVETVTPPGAGCDVERTVKHRVVDEGTTGIEETIIEINAAACPAPMFRNDGCVVTHTFDLAFDLVRDMP